MAFISSVGVDIEHALERTHLTGRDSSLIPAWTSYCSRSSDEDECQNVPLRLMLLVKGAVHYIPEE